MRKDFTVLACAILALIIALAGCVPNENNNGDTDGYVALNEFYPWIGELNVEDIVGVRSETSNCIPGMFNKISYSANSVDIENAYCLLSAPLKAITEEESHVAGGGYVKYDFYTADKSYSLTVGSNMVRIEDRHYKFLNTFYYAFLYPNLDCYSFYTLLPGTDEYEIYVCADGSKVGDFDGLGGFEFCAYDGQADSAPKYSLKSSVADLLILSHDLFMIDGGEDNVVYRITGEKDFSALFE